jgi:arsenate reductase
MGKSVRALARTTLFALPGGVVGAGAGALMCWVAGLTEALGDGIRFGAALGMVTGVLLSGPFENWSPPGWLQSLPGSLRGLFGQRREAAPPANSGALKPEAVVMALDTVRDAAPPRQEARKPAVLFLCVANSARSQMAEALLRKYAGDYFEVFSAGLRPREIHPLTIRVMAENGLDLSGQQPKGVRQFLGRLTVQVAITVCAAVEEDCPTHWLGARTRLSWPFPDPAAATGTEEERLAAFRAVRDQLDVKIRTWLREIRLPLPPGNEQPVAKGV